MQPLDLYSGKYEEILPAHIQQELYTCYYYDSNVTNILSNKHGEPENVFVGCTKHKYVLFGLSRWLSIKTMEKNWWLSIQSRIAILLLCALAMDGCLLPPATTPSESTTGPSDSQNANYKSWIYNRRWSNSNTPNFKNFPSGHLNPKSPIFITSPSAINLWSLAKEASLLSLTTPNSLNKNSKRLANAKN